MEPPPLISTLQQKESSEHHVAIIVPQEAIEELPSNLQAKNKSIIQKFLRFKKTFDQELFWV